MSFSTSSVFCCLYEVHCLMYLFSLYFFYMNLATSYIIRKTLAAPSKQHTYMKTNPMSYLALTSTHGVKMSMEYERTYITRRLYLSIMFMPRLFIGENSKWRPSMYMEKAWTTTRQGRGFVTKDAVHEPKNTRWAKKKEGRT